jgi:NAD(P) transhydrogenase subunit beta
MIAQLCVMPFWLVANSDPTIVAAEMDPIANLGYLIAALLLIIGLTGLAHPQTARKAGLIGAAGIAVAIVTVVARSTILGPIVFGAAGAIGAGIGMWLAAKLEWSSRWNFAALFNALGGLTANIVAGAGLLEEPEPSYQFVICAAVAGALGGVVFAGSLLAFVKLENHRWFEQPVGIGGRPVVNVVLLAAVVALGVWLVQSSRVADGVHYGLIYIGLSLASAALGALWVWPLDSDRIGQAVTCLAGASGFAIAAIGFMLDNSVLIIAGALIGACGTKLSRQIVVTDEASRVRALGEKTPTPV